MWSIAETIEFEVKLVTASPCIWITEGVLYWPPDGSSIDRSILIPPEPDWIPFPCKVLKENIETFEEALVLEKRYSKHRNSSSFHEYQEQQKMKRLHPVNYANQSNLIDLNDMVAKIDANSDAGDTTQENRYHENCKASVYPKTGTHSKNVLPRATIFSSKPKTGTSKENAQSVKKTAKKPLPFQTNYLKSGVLKAKNRVVTNLIQAKPRYDNFLQSGNRFHERIKANPKVNVPSATITKEQYLKQIGATSDIDMNNEVPAPENFGCTSTPVESQVTNRRENYITVNDGGRTSDYHNTTHNSVERSTSENEFLNELNSDNVPTNIRSATTISAPQNISFEERVLKELGDLKKTQAAFEAKIERKIETFFNNNSQIQNNGSSQIRGNSQSQIRSNSQKQIQSDQFGSIRNELHVRRRDPVPAVRYIDDFEEFEEIDKNFPVDILSNVERLEYHIRKDLEFKFLLHSRLNELGGANFKKCIRLTMKYLFTDPVLEHYTWRGTEEKNSFQKLKALNNLILQSVRDRCPNVKRDDYKDYMIQWLKHAKSRQRKVTYSYPNRENLGRDDSSDGDGDEF